MNKNVIIYTSSLCGFCYSAKSLLKRKNIPYEEINIDFFRALKEDSELRQNYAKAEEKINKIQFCNEIKNEEGVSAMKMCRKTCGVCTKEIYKTSSDLEYHSSIMAVDGELSGSMIIGPNINKQDYITIDKNKLNKESKAIFYIKTYNSDDNKLKLKFNVQSENEGSKFLIYFNDNKDVSEEIIIKQSKFFCIFLDQKNQCAFHFQIQSIVRLFLHFYLFERVQIYILFCQ